MKEIEIIIDKKQKENIAQDILYDLPEWFGIPESTKEYIENAKNQFFIAARMKNDYVGFLTLVPHNSDTIEIHVLGVKKAWQGKKIGTMLIEQAKIYARENGYRIIEVKTLDKRHPDLYYKKTRHFYERCGFLRLECLEEVWGKQCPCLILVLPL